jgi:hypothetical protein
MERPLNFVATWHVFIGFTRLSQPMRGARAHHHAGVSILRGFLFVYYFFGFFLGAFFFVCAGDEGGVEIAGS